LKKGIGKIGHLKKEMLSFCSNCSGWLLTVVYKPRFCTRCGSPIGRVVPLLEYAILAAVAAAVVLAII
jgi:hypothetical protein